MIYDTVICVGFGHRNICLKTIKSLHYFLDSRKIFIISTPEIYNGITKRLDDYIPLHFIDEDKLLDNLHLKGIENVLEERIARPERATWYFQQFLKMAVCEYPGIADYYLIWDSDTILLEKIKLFDENGAVIVDPQIESHEPYFKWIKKNLGISKQVDFSFISQHLMINKRFMKELIDTIQTTVTGDKSWFEFILESIDDGDLKKSGFSEFETYGNFVAFHHRESFTSRPLMSSRIGANYFGMNPNRLDLFRLRYNGYVHVSFEIRDLQPMTKIVKEKIMSIIFFMIRFHRGSVKDMLADVKEICG